MQTNVLKILKNMFPVLSVLPFLVTVLVSVYSCDNPRDRRVAYNDELYSKYPYNYPYNYPYGGDTSVTTTTSVGTSTNTGGLTIPADAKHCQFYIPGQSEYQYYSNVVGPYSLCQSSSDRFSFYFQGKNAVTDANVCLIPLATGTTGPVCIGEPRCLYINGTQQLVNFKLSANRTGFENRTISGVLIVKNKKYFFPAPFSSEISAPDAYLICSEALYAYGNSAYCEAFKSLGEYTYHPF